MIETETYPIIIVDDETEVLETESLILEMNGFGNVVTCSGGKEALEACGSNEEGIVLLDVTMPEMDGVEVLKKIKEEVPQYEVIMLTGVNDAETAVTCLKTGAFDYIVKPIDQTRLLTCVNKALQHKRIADEARMLGECMLSDNVRQPEFFSHIITGNRKMFDIFRYIEAVAPTGLPILLTGETGAGKELFARAVHNASGRSGEFVCVNTAGIDDTLFSDTLFGHVSGAFTGAQTDRKGLISRADGGTLFLDEIGDMRPETQVKLLRLLQEGTFYRLGAEREEHSCARIVAATNKPIDALRSSGAFRKDLYYRLKAHHIALPPLRERLDDVSLLLDHFLQKAAAEQGKVKPTAPPELTVLLRNYDYPGNVRELQGMVSDAVGRHNGRVLSCESFREATGLTEEIKTSATEENAVAGNECIFPVKLPTAKILEKTLVEEAYRRSEGNRKLAAEMIGMTRQTFTNKLKELGIVD